MATQTLGISITSNVSGALPGINGVTGGLNGMSVAAGQAASSLSLLGPSISRSSQAFNSLIQQGRQGQLSLIGINGAATNLGQSLNRTRRPAIDASNALTNLGRVASDAPFGFIAIQNNLDPLIQSFGQVFRQSSSVAEGFRNIGRSLVGAAGIGLAFSVVSSLVTTLIQKYGSLSNGLNALNPFLDNAAKAQNSWNASLLAAQGPAAKEISSVNLLYAATQDLNVPLNERKRIANELIKQYPQSFKGLTDEKILAGEAADAYNKLTKSLLATATVKAAQGFIEENQKSLIGLRLEATRLDNQLAELRKPDTGFISEDPISVDRKINAAQNAINGNKAKQRELEQQNALILAEQLKLIEQYGAAAAGVGETEDKTTKKKKEAKEHLTDQQKILKALAENIRAIDAEFLAVGGNVQDLTQNKVKAFQTALGDLAKINVLPGNPVFDAIKDQITALQGLLKQTPVTIQIPINVEPLPSAKNTAAIQGIAAGLNDDFSRAFTSAQDKVFTDILEKAAEDGIASISSAIGKALTGGGFSGIFDAFINGIAGLGEGLGKQLITTGVAIEAFKTSLASLSGFQAIAAGAALIAASAAFRSLAKGGVASFATGGGVIGGPQLAVIGDNPGREEYVIPSEVLDKMGTGYGEVGMRLTVNEFLIWLDRGRRNLNG